MKLHQYERTNETFREKMRTFSFAFRKLIARIKQKNKIINFKIGKLGYLHYFYSNCTVVNYAYFYDYQRCWSFIFFCILQFWRLPYIGERGGHLPSAPLYSLHAFVVNYFFFLYFFHLKGFDSLFCFLLWFFLLCFHQLCIICLLT